MSSSETIARTYPRDITVGSKTVTLRLMVPSDRDAVLAFARSLPPNDLLFLRLDITRPEGVDEWVRNLEAGRTHTVLAVADGAIAGYASVHHNDVMWTRHVGELRVMVGSEYRRQGLGRRLTDDIVTVAGTLGVQKLTVQMTTDQKGARATFERLGFRAEALLADYVVDQDGRTRDLLVMSHDVAGFTNVEHASAASSAR